MRAGARIAVLACALFAALALGIAIGGSTLPVGTVLSALLHPHAGGDAVTIVWALRLPRVVAAALVGASLAIAGFLLQGMLRNPLVDPFLTGVSAGAAAAIALGVVLGLATALLPVVGFFAGLGTAFVVALLARRGTGLDAERLILAGVSLSALFSAFVALALTRLGRGGSDAILAWLAGSLAGRGWGEIAVAVPYLAAGVALALISVRSLNVLRLGDGVAQSVGVDLARIQWIVLVASTLLTATAVSLSGIVGFVGLIVPHIARRIVGTSATLALPASALLGATLVPLADAVCRAIDPPLEVPLGVLLAFIGVPAFLYLYLRPGSTRLWGM